MTELHDLSALEQAAQIRSRSISSVDLTEHYLTRSAALGHKVGAFVVLTPELALAQAKSADAAVAAAAPDEQLPAFLGVVCPVKDLDLVAGVPTRFGSTALTITPLADENVVAKMRAAGLVFTGKTNTPEFGLPCYTEPEIAPPARTPWDLKRSAGGSSGGAAAAVAAGLAPFAQGSDGGGSIRIPAAVTGLVGIKPSRGRISNGPFQDMIGELNTNGPIARNVADAAALLDAMAGGFPGDPSVAPLPTRGTFLDAARREPGNLRIGFYTNPVVSTAVVHPDVVAAVANTAGALADLGHHVEEITGPYNDVILPAFRALWSVLAAVTPLTPEQEEQLRPLTRYLRAQGRTVAGADLGAALGFARIFVRGAVEATQHFDVLVAPTIADIPALVGQLRNDEDPAADFEAQMNYAPFSAVYNLSGQPAINVPLNWNDAGLPIGVQLVGRQFDEETIISVAAQLEATHGWSGRRPAMW